MGSRASSFYDVESDIFYTKIPCLKKIFNIKNNRDNFKENNNKKKYNLIDFHNKLAKSLNISQMTFFCSLGNIDINDIFLSVPIEKRDRCENCDIQRVLSKIKKIHDSDLKKKIPWNDNKCYCRICSSIILYDPHCVCGIYED